MFNVVCTLVLLYKSNGSIWGDESQLRGRVISMDETTYQVDFSQVNTSNVVISDLKTIRTFKKHQCIKVW